MNWHLESVESVVDKLKTHRDEGLSTSEAQSRLAQHGRNELIEKGGRTPWQIIWEQWIMVATTWCIPFS